MNNRSAFSIGMIVAPLALLSLGVAFASNVSTPNAFVANTAAVASEVNANFAAHAAAINDNNSKIVNHESTLAGVKDFILDYNDGALNGQVKAAVAVNLNGTLSRSFVLPNGWGTPVVSKTQTGVYKIEIPGATGLHLRYWNIARHLPAGMTSVTPALLSPNDTIFVYTYDDNGNPVDCGFHLTIN